MCVCACVSVTFKPLLIQDHCVVLRGLSQTEELASEWGGGQRGRDQQYEIRIVMKHKLIPMATVALDQTTVTIVCIGSCLLEGSFSAAVSVWLILGRDLRLLTASFRFSPLELR